MNQHENRPVHWVTFAGRHLFETVNPLWAYLEMDAGQLEKVSVLCDTNDSEINGQILDGLTNLLDLIGKRLSVEKIDIPDDPASSVKYIAKLLAGYLEAQERVAIDVSAVSSSHTSAFLGQMAMRHNNLQLLSLHHIHSSYGKSPLALTPSCTYSLFSLEDCETRLIGKGSPGEVPASLRGVHKKWLFSPQELVILLNGFLELGFDRNLLIRLPLVGDLNLCRVGFRKDGVDIKGFVQEAEYRKRVNNLKKSLTPHARQQLANYDQMVHLFYAAGILKPSGLSELMNQLEEVASHPLDLGGDVYHLALDTNLLRDRFYTNYLSRLSLSPNTDFVLCETVRSELLNRLDKINQKFLDEMAPLGQDLVRALFRNQNQLEDRLRYIGLLEFNRMKAATGCREQDSEFGHSSARNDRYILDAYSRFVGVGCKVLFLSRDQETIRMMRGEEGVLTLLLEHRDRPQKDFGVSWQSFLEWLYLLSVTYGRMEWVIGNAAVAVVDGVWAGKSVTEWEEDRARVQLVAPQNDQDRQDYEILARCLSRSSLILQRLATVTTGSEFHVHACPGAT